MAISNINTIINDDIHKVWDIVFAVDKYSAVAKRFKQNRNHK